MRCKRELFDTIAVEVMVYCPSESLQSGLPEPPAQGFLVGAEVKGPLQLRLRLLQINPELVRDLIMVIKTSVIL